MKQTIVVETFNTSFFRLTYPFFAKGKVSKNYICLWGEINEFGILSTLKSEKKFSVLEKLSVSARKNSFPKFNVKS